MEMTELTRGRIEQVQPAFSAYPDILPFIFIDTLGIVARKGMAIRRIVAKPPKGVCRRFEEVDPTVYGPEPDAMTAILDGRFHFVVADAGLVKGIVFEGRR